MYESYLPLVYMCMSLFVCVLVSSYIETDIYEVPFKRFVLLVTCLNARTHVPESTIIIIMSVA